MTDPRIGQTLDGRYVLRRRIGKGGMGVVYEAEHTALERRVAIKLIAAAEAPAGYLERFRREARLASRISHEHLAHIYDVGTDPATGADFIVMEYVEGRDLGQELAAGPLSFTRAIAITKQLLSALHAIHEEGIIHRDIKPANVMLTTRSGERDFVKLMDFGIAKGLDDSTLTMTGHVVGTPSFMAPEQLRGQALDARTDLYAAGVTLFAMIAGRLPFEGDTAMLAGAHVFQPPPSLAKLRRDTPPAIVAAVERALAKTPADRFPDSQKFAAALETAPPDRAAVAAAPSRLPWVAAGAAGASLIAGILWFVQRPETPREEVATATPAPPPARAPAIDAAVAPDAPPRDAVVNAGEPSPAPPTGKGSASAKTVAVSAKPAQSCQCVPLSAPDIYGLCPKPGKPLCRCDDEKGNSLCSTPLVPIDNCDKLKGLRDCKMSIGSWICPDPHYSEFQIPGKHDAPCKGYKNLTFRGAETKERDGHLECDVCPGVPLDRFRGQPGDACTGFYWRTGEQKAGTLAHCVERI